MSGDVGDVAEPGAAAIVGAGGVSSSSVAPDFQSQVRQRRTTPLLFSFLTTNLAWHAGHGCGIGRSQVTNSQPFDFQFEHP